ncbi:MGMT family protein, partial [Singulisphaera rosea]
RAVGQALGKNPIALIIPCHRILAAGGKPGGFSAHGGRSTKAWMLAVEGAPMGAPATLNSEKDLRRLAPSLVARDSRLTACLARPIVFKRKGGESPYACLFSAVVHQQLSPKAASTILGRVKSLYPDEGIPGPQELLETPDESLRAAGLSGAKTASLKDLAAKTFDGTVPSSQEIQSLSDEEIVKRLVSIRGVGRWTVEMLLIFHLGRMDVLPADDYALRRVVGEIYELGEVPNPKQLLALGESWRPLRTVASLYFWNSLKS